MKPQERRALWIKAYIIFLTTFFCLWQGFDVAAAPVSTIVVDQGKPVAVLIVDDQAPPTVHQAAAILQSYVKLSSKAQLPIVKASELQPPSDLVSSFVSDIAQGKIDDRKILGLLGLSEGEPIRIWVGPSPYVNRLELLKKGVDDDGFVIAFPDSRNIVIVGKTDWGTEFGVYEFLERYVGVRWLIPGPDGEHVPEKSSIVVPQQEVRQEPAFFSRELYGFKGQAQLTWARRQRMHARVRFHHNLLKLFPPEKYTKTNPEFFPIIDGKRFLPATNNTHGWQPCFNAPGIVDEAVRNIKAYFAQNPRETSYSLGVNDAVAPRGSGYCETATKKNFLGLPDLSDSYYAWTNAVAKGVLETYPDKWFGCLAYYEVAQPPSKVKVHPRIVPFMTYDRHKWIDANTESEGKKITEWWAKEVSYVGWYDYMYGTPYLVPRVYFHTMADYYRYGYKNKVRAVYAEAYPNWGEGPKLYVAMKLLWNPNLDVDALLNEWYVAFAGPDAAPHLASYFSLWEDFWTRRIKDSEWFKKALWTYLPFSSPAYLDAVTYGDIEKSKGLLETALSKTHTPKQRSRVKVLLDAFEYYEASAISYLGLVKKVKIPNRAEQYFRDMENKRAELTNKFESDPILVHPLRADRQYKGLMWGK